MAAIVAAPAGAATPVDRPAAAGRDVVVETADGKVRGLEADGLVSFLGMPYAAPPVGGLRWRPPQSPAAWKGVRDADAFGNSCVQTAMVGGFATGSETEDCLFLNVVAPAPLHPSGRPVMVWIHGGGGLNGRGDDYDGRKLAKEGDVVFVSFNYRVNVFGYFAHPALDGEGHPVANYGLMDQQFALRWVKRNIRAFGGDPDKVTIFGESGGGAAVLMNMVSPASAGLFHRAIIESGVSRSRWMTLPQAETIGKDFALKAGCADQEAACLRSLSVRQILDRARAFTVSPPARTVDGALIPQQWQEAFAAGEFNRTPVLLGNNHDEYTWFQGVAELTTNRPMEPEDYLKTLTATFGDERAARIIREYPLASYGSPSEAFSAVMSAGHLICPANKAARTLARHTPVYVYEFMDRTAPSFMKAASFPYGAGHTAELQYIFPGFHGAAGERKPLNPDQMRLSGEMVAYWTRFAAKGDPNSDARPRWPRFTPDEPRIQLLQLGGSSPAVDAGVDRKCGFWDSL